MRRILAVLALGLTLPASGAPPLCSSSVVIRSEAGNRLTWTQLDGNMTRIRELCAADILDIPTACSNGQIVGTSGGLLACVSDDDVPDVGDFGALALTGDVTSSGLATTIAADAVALGMDTTGAYVAGVTASQGLALTGSEGGTLGLQDCAALEVLQRNAGDTAWACAAMSGGGGSSDHGALTGLGDDDHSQYALLAGRSGGQSLMGGTASGDNLTLYSTAHSTAGQIRLMEDARVISTTTTPILWIDGDSFDSQSAYARITCHGNGYCGIEFMKEGVRQVYMMLFPDENFYLGRDGAQRLIVNVPTDFTDGTLRLVPRSSPLVTCDAAGRGSMYYDSDDGDFCDCVGTGWRSRGGAGTCS